MIVWAGVAVQRSFTAPAFLTSYLDADPKDVTCPQCGAEMVEGYLALLAGLHWRQIDEPIGMPHALSGLPGTVGWRARPRLHGFCCETCSVVTFKYGDRPTLDCDGSQRIRFAGSSGTLGWHPFRKQLRPKPPAE